MRRLRRGQEAAFCRNPVRKIAVARRIHAIEAGADDRERRPRAKERALVRRGVHSEGQARDDGQPGLRQCVRKVARVVQPLRGRIAAAHDRERGAVQQFAPAHEKKHGRRIAQFQ
jgi:hypothetical protein